MRSVPYRDSNVLLDILTGNRGLITCSVLHARSKNSPFKIVTENFVFAEFELFYYRERYRLQNAELIDAYTPLREDITRLTCMAHIAELVLDVVRHQPEAAGVYSFWAYASYKITHSADPILITYLAQLKFLADQGFAPWVFDCLICHRPFNQRVGGRFYFEKGGAVCADSDCQKNIGESKIMLLKKDTLLSLSQLIQLPHEKCFNIEIKPECREEIIRFSGEYLSYIMGKAYPKLDLLISLEKFEKGYYE